jgi:hypothetical protein
MAVMGFRGGAAGHVRPWAKYALFDAVGANFTKTATASPHLKPKKKGDLRRPFMLEIPKDYSA